jgi:hypothetical protein
MVTRPPIPPLAAFQTGDWPSCSSSKIGFPPAEWFTIAAVVTAAPVAELLSENASLEDSRGSLVDARDVLLQALL